MVDEGGLVVAWHESGMVKSILGCGERPCEFRDKLGIYRTSFPSFELLCYNAIPQMQLRCTIEKLANILVFGLRKCPRLRPFATI